MIYDMKNAFAVIEEKRKAKKEQRTDSASNWVISASSCSRLLCSSSISSAGLILASSDTWSLEGQTRKHHI